MKGVLERFVMIKQALGFKGEKTVSMNARTKQIITYQTMAVMVVRLVVVVVLAPVTGLKCSIQWQLLLWK